MRRASRSLERSRTRSRQRRRHACEYLEDRLVVGSVIDLFGGMLSGLNFAISPWDVSAPETIGVDVRSNQQEMPDASSSRQDLGDVPPPTTCLDHLAICGQSDRGRWSEDRKSTRLNSSH